MKLVIFGATGFSGHAILKLAFSKGCGMNRSGKLMTERLFQLICHFMVKAVRLQKWMFVEILVPKICPVPKMQNVSGQCKDYRKFKQ